MHCRNHVNDALATILNWILDQHRIGALQLQPCPGDGE